MGIPPQHPQRQCPRPARPSRPLPCSFASRPRRPTPRPLLHPCCWTWVFLQASGQPRAPDVRRSPAEALSHPHPGHHALLLAPQAPHVHHPWASSADLGPHPFAAALIPGALCRLGHGLLPCLRHSLHPAGHPGPCSQTQTPSGTPHLPTPSGEAPRTAGHRPKTWVPRPLGCRRRDLEWARPLPRAPAALEESQHTLEQELGQPLQLPQFPQGPHPRFGGQEHYTAQEAFTLDGGPAPPYLKPPSSPALLGPDTVPSWLGGPEPVSGNCPQG